MLASEGFFLFYLFHQLSGDLVYVLKVTLVFLFWLAFVAYNPPSLQPAWRVVLSVGTARQLHLL